MLLLDEADLVMPDVRIFRIKIKPVPGITDGKHVIDDDESHGPLRIKFSKLVDDSETLSSNPLIVKLFSHIFKKDDGGGGL